MAAAAAAITVVEVRSKNRTGVKKIPAEDANPFNISKKAPAKKESSNPFNLKSTQGPRKSYQHAAVFDEDDVSDPSGSCLQWHPSPASSEASSTGYESLSTEKSRFYTPLLRKFKG